MQVTASRGAAAAGEDDAENPAAAAKGKVVSAMMRKHLVEGIVPVMVELKRLLEAKNHPLLSQLMLAMRVLLKDHKSEVSPSCSPAFASLSIATSAMPLCKSIRTCI